jgi:hypothetical protein
LHGQRYARSEGRHSCDKHEWCCRTNGDRAYVYRATHAFFVIVPTDEKLCCAACAIDFDRLVHNHLLSL